MTRIYKGGIILSLILAFTTCRKGPDDPFLSLKSRKTRLEGTWRLESGSASYTENNSFNATFSFGATSYRENTTPAGNGPLVVYIGTYLLNLTISKNGTFTLKETLAGYQLDSEGTWSFNSGIGEDKKKEDVEFFITKVNSGTTFSRHIFNRNSTNFFYKIKELRDKKLVIKSSGKFFSDTGDHTDLLTEYTFTQK